MDSPVQFKPTTTRLWDTSTPLLGYNSLSEQSKVLWQSTLASDLKVRTHITTASHSVANHLSVGSLEVNDPRRTKLSKKKEAELQSWRHRTGHAPAHGCAFLSYFSSKNEKKSVFSASLSNLLNCCLNWNNFEYLPLGSRKLWRPCFVLFFTFSDISYIKHLINKSRK